MLDPKNKIVLLDRDGVINIDSESYIKSASEWHPIPGSLEAMAQLTRAGYDIFIVTNQSGLHRGFFNTAELERIHTKMHTLLNQCGGQIIDIVYCPHRPEEFCSCRKPKTGLLDELHQRHGLIFNGVPFIGDSLKDLDCANAAGAKAGLVLTGKGRKTLTRLMQKQPERLTSLPVYINLAQAVNEWLKV
ncbi:MAG: D-glycero-beta-D-manno-heptose 1,7-bisphosphate 7-phosphatase [Gammaproteobacteria bacterium]